MRKTASPNGSVKAVPNSLKLKLREWMGINEALNRMDQLGTVLPLTAGLRISYLREHMMKMFNVFERVKEQELRKVGLFGKEDLTADERETVIKAIDPLLDEEFEHPFTKITEEQLANLSLPPGVIFALRHLIVRPPEFEEVKNEPESDPI